MSIEPDTQLAAHSDVKQRIMKAAEKLFADKGFHATSISDITDAADVGRALIYYYFKDKRDLFDSILRADAERMVSLAEEAYATEQTALPRLRRFLVMFRQQHIDHPDSARIAMRARIEDNLAFHKFAEEGFAKLSAVLKRIVEEGVSQGELRPVDPEKTIHMVMGMLHSLIIMHIQAGEESSSKDNIDFAMNFLAHGIVNQNEIPDTTT